MTKMVPIASEGFGDNKTPAICIRSVTSAVARETVGLAERIQIRPARMIACEHCDEQQTICISSGKEGATQFVLLTVCKEGQRGAARVYALRNKLDELRDAIVTALQKSAKYYQLRQVDDGASLCALQQLPKKKVKPRHNPGGPLHPNFPTPVWIEKPTLRRLYLMLLQLGQAAGNNPTLAVNAYSRQLNGRREQGQLDGWFTIGLNTLKTMGLVQIIGQDKLLVFRVQLADCAEQAAELAAQHTDGPTKKTTKKKTTKKPMGDGSRKGGGAPPKPEGDNMSRPITDTQRAMHAALLEVAEDKESPTVEISGYAGKLMALKGFDIAKGSISGRVAQLIKLKVVEQAGRGTIRVHRQLPAAPPSSDNEPTPTPARKKAAKKKASKKKVAKKASRGGKRVADSHKPEETALVVGGNEQDMLTTMISQGTPADEIANTILTQAGGLKKIGVLMLVGQRLQEAGFEVEQLEDGRIKTSLTA